MILPLPPEGPAERPLSRGLSSSSLEMVGWDRGSAASSFHGILLALARIWSVGVYGQEPSLKEAWSCGPIARGTPVSPGYDCLYTCAWHFAGETGASGQVLSRSQRLPGELDVDPEGSGG